MPIRRFVLALLLPAPFADPDAITDAADEVLRLFRTGDTAGLAALAARAQPDPWLVADELWEMGELPAAEAFALASTRPDTERLPEFLRLSQRAEARHGGARADRVGRAGAAAGTGLRRAGRVALVAPVQGVRPPHARSARGGGDLAPRSR